MYHVVEWTIFLTLEADQWPQKTIEQRYTVDVEKERKKSRLLTGESYTTTIESDSWEDRLDPCRYSCWIR